MPWTTSSLALYLYPNFDARSYFTTDSQLVSMSRCRAPLWDWQPDITSCRYVAVWNMRSYFCGKPLSREDGSANVAQSFNGSILLEHVTIFLSHLRLPQHGLPGSCIYIPQEQGGPVTAPGIGFPLRRQLRLLGLRWKYSNPPPNWKARFPYIRVYPSGTGWSSPKSKVKFTLLPTVSQSVCLGL
jgi:hypothetical protein